ncbi:MAG: Transposase IS116/IS110/IS902 family protein [Methanocella sp. PtaU1.Bin125]|nr:MAG: Transposase IS116/IS110/IS902 family protein [Methanocella sp. PtaU1.Bin125]
MVECLNKVCGVDVHKRFIAATILSRAGEKEYREFGTELGSLLEFKDWVVSNRCERVAFESTGVYWIPVHMVLEGHVELLLANAQFIKNHPGRKTDKIDSGWIAELCLNNQIVASRVFQGTDREFRWLTRHRENLVNNVTQCKNRIHKALQTSQVKLSSVLSDVFGMTGMMIVEGLLRRDDPEVIVKRIKTRALKEKAPLILEAIRTGLDPVSCMLIRDNLAIINALTERIEDVDAEINRYILAREEDFRIALSMPGMGQVNASAILSEIGDYHDFRNGDSLAHWFGITPSLYQSADKRINGSITKRGSPHARKTMVEAAWAAIKAKGTIFNRAYLRIKARRGAKVAIVAIARKMLCILHHLLVNREMYMEKGIKEKHFKIKTTASSKVMTVEEMIKCLHEAGYIVRRDKGFKGCT